MPQFQPNPEANPSQVAIEIADLRKPEIRHAVELLFEVMASALNMSTQTQPEAALPEDSDGDSLATVINIDSVRQRIADQAQSNPKVVDVERQSDDLAEPA